MLSSFSFLEHFIAVLEHCSLEVQDDVPPDWCQCYKTFRILISMERLALIRSYEDDSTLAIRFIRLARPKLI